MMFPDHRKPKVMMLLPFLKTLTWKSRQLKQAKCELLPHTKTWVNCAPRVYSILTPLSQEVPKGAWLSSGGSAISREGEIQMNFPPEHGHESGAICKAGSRAALERRHVGIPGPWVPTWCAGQLSLVQLKGYQLFTSASLHAQGPGERTVR